MLTVKQIDAAKPAEKSYRLADAGELFLFVPSSGKKVWRMRYADELSRMFQDDILPMIGSTEIQDIEPTQILAVIRRFEERGAMERANKARKPILEKL